MMDLPGGEEILMLYLSVADKQNYNKIKLTFRQQCAVKIY